MSNLYFVQDNDGAVKIGFTTQIGKRVRALSGGAKASLVLLGSVPGTRQHEKAMHEILDPYRMGGEWFRGVEPVLSLIRRVMLDGTDILDVPLSRSDQVDAVMLHARAVAKTIVKYAQVGSTTAIEQRLKEIEAQYGIRSGTLWMLHYRPNADMGTGAFYALLDGAEVFLEDVAAAIDRDAVVIGAAQERYRRIRAAAAFASENDEGEG